MNKSIFFLLFTVIVSFSLFGQDSAAAKAYTTREYPWVMRSVAALGMGNAYYTKSDSKYAPFYNPAGLARIKRNWRFDLVPVGVTLNNYIVDLAQGGTDKYSDNDALVGIFQDFIGSPVHLGVSLYPGFTKQNFTVGAFSNAQINALVGNSVLPEPNVDIVADAGAVVGISRSFLEDKLQTGVALRYQQRYSFVHSYTFSDFANDKFQSMIKEISKEPLAALPHGWGILFDAGAIYNFWTDGINPRAGLAINNMGMHLGDAKDVPYSITLSGGVSPYFGILKSDIILDIVDITHHFEQDNDWAKRINLGLELNVDLPVLRWFKFRGGIHQGYWTYGLGFDTNFIQANFAYYKEELGAYAGQKGDPRYALEFILSF